MQRSSVRVVAAACAWTFALALGALPAQGRTWIVDAANGPGAQFTDVPAAVAAAADGDRIRVRAGTYSTASTGKALTIVNEGGAAFSSVASTFDVNGLPAGRDFALQGFDFGSIVKPQLRVRNCAGRVLLDRLRFTPFPGQITFGPAIAIEASALVTLQAVQALGSPAVLASGSTVHVVASDLTGTSAVLIFQLQQSLPALDASTCRVEVTESRLTGGDGMSPSPLVIAPPSPAIRAVATTLRIAGSSTTCVLAAGTGTVVAASAVQGTGGGLRLDPNVLLKPYRSAPAIGGDIAVQVTDLPAVQAFGAPPGGVVRVELFGRAGNAAALFVSPPADVQPFPALAGDLGLDPLRMVHALTVTIGASGRVTLNVPVPNDPLLRATSWVWQGVAGTAANGFVLSNSSRYVQN